MDKHIKLFYIKPVIGLRLGLGSVLG